MIKPTESELEILNILWTNGPSSVREVNKKINEQKEVGYTTTLKLMQIMTQKGLVERDESSRSHIYSARIKAEDIQEQMQSEHFDSWCGICRSTFTLFAHA